MSNENVRLYWHDRILAKTLIPLIPRDVRPNHFTILRVLITPLICYYMWFGIYDLALTLFLFAALTDILDGVLARVRKQITAWGTVADPAADKLLIGSVVLIFVTKEINMTFAVVIIVIEILIILSGLARKGRGESVSANWFGKWKMVLQVTGVAGLLVARLSGVHFFVPFSIGTFGLAIVFAVISLLTYGL